MFNVVVVNEDRDEGNTWLGRLRAAGFAVLPWCAGFSEMVDILMKEKARVVLISANVVNCDNFAAVVAASKFFIRTKFVIVGDPNIANAFLTLKRTDGTIVKTFDAALNNCCLVMAPSAPLTGKAGYGMTEEQCAKLLLGDHFLSDEEAALLTGQTFNWASGYVVIGITVDSNYGRVRETLEKEAGRRGYAYLLQYNHDEFYAIIDNAPSAERVLKLANGVRDRLVEETGAIFSIGVSRMRRKAGELCVCRKEAARAFRSTYMFGNNGVILIDFLDSNDIEYLYPKHKEQKLIESALDGDVECAFRMLDEIFEVLKSCREVKQELINRIVLGIIVSLNIAATLRVFAFGQLNLDSLALSRLKSAKSVGEAHDYLKKGIEEFAKEMDAVTEVTRDALFYRLTAAKNTKKQIHISDLANVLGTTPAYINAAINRNCNGDIFSFFSGGVAV